MALWVALVLGEPSLVHSCPVHGGGAAAVGQHGDMAGMAGHAAATHGAPASNRDGGQRHHHACTCPGDCTSTGTGPAALLPSPDVTVDAAERLVVAAAAPTAESRRARPAPPHALPFANGPPAPARAA